MKNNAGLPTPPSAVSRGHTFHARWFTITANRPEKIPKWLDVHHNELIVWAETTYGASPNREDRAVFGLSNGAAFASWMGTHHPEIFGAAIVFSQGWKIDYEPPADAPPVRFYLQVGTLEPAFHSETNHWREVLEAAGVEVSYHERVTGHDGVQWEEEIANALVRVFGTGD